MADKTFTITDGQIKAMAKAFEGIQPLGGVQDFCRVWPDVEKGLEMLKTIAGLVPGFGSIAQMAIGIVEAAGGAASTALCKK